MAATIKAVAYHVPEAVLSNADLASAYPDWSVDKIEEKTGIRLRHVAGQEECASDLAVAACRKLFAEGACRPDEVDFLLLCTQSPDYFLPASACIVQDRIGLPTTVGALDFNQGCSGYVYGLGLAKGLIDTGQARNVLLVTAETYSKHIHPADKSVRTLFGDAAAATLVGEAPGGGLGPFVYGTDGRGFADLIVPAGGMRRPRTAATSIAHDDGQGNQRAEDNLYMNGPGIYTFTLRAVPELLAQALAKAGRTLGEVDHFVFHQANRFMLESLRRKLRIPEEKFLTSFEDFGNTVSSTIPIVLRDKLDQGVIRPGDRLLLVGFGVGLSWGATWVEWA